ncbi:hypothetical protein ACFVXW_37130 [Streptomyces sp. NPDC058251]|uniref:hypothetical protein n=1 Tax=Streptomyces sp. NPDC058251 TaxID=3346404 RepID=UPI0036F00985
MPIKVPAATDKPPTGRRHRTGIRRHLTDSRPYAADGAVSAAQPSRASGSAGSADHSSREPS